MDYAIQEIETRYNVLDTLISKSYLSNLPSCPVVKLEENPFFNLNNCVRYWDISQIVLNKNEDMRDKLVSVFNAVGSSGSSLLFLVKGSKERTSIRVGIRNDSGNSNEVVTARNILERSLSGNFPGTKYFALKKDIIERDLADGFSSDRCEKIVTTVTDIAGLRSENSKNNNTFMQGLEKIVDSMQGQEYMAILIADPISKDDLSVSRRSLENIYSSLVPFSGSMQTVSRSESESVNRSFSESATDTFGYGISDMISHTTGKSFTKTKGTSKTETKGTSHSTTEGTFASESKGATKSFNIGQNFGGGFSFAPFGIGINISHNTSFGVGYSRTTTNTQGRNHAETETMHSSTSYGVNESSSVGTNSSSTEGRTFSSNRSSAKTTGETNGRGSSLTLGESIQFKQENHSVVNLMKRIDKILDRYDQSADVGMWNCAMYCVAEKETSRSFSSIYRSTVRGKDSSLENGALIVWDKSQNDDIISYLKRMEHPRFLLGENIEITAGSLISSSELSIHASFPRHSVSGIPVIECAEFGRAIASFDGVERENKTIPLGKIYNMHQEEIQPVNLNQNSFCSHVFVTGSTGSGKSNTVYKMLDSLRRNKVNFLVVEPAKGEYKHVFGDVAKVYGTNPSLSAMLKLNPFSFPKSIHISEHLDRLIEIFNACWPMYAAMPAVLKDAVIKAYEDVGWDMLTSQNRLNGDFYPSFSDVASNVRSIIESSEYDTENKGAYKGSLITRLKSLTNGINGLIFTSSDAIPEMELFDENVIVDISRVGSCETKSLIMGLLVMKLQEYRMAKGGMNLPLKHVTVLEEAHNLLRRTSTEQSAESANLLGKSVEMLANSIAEMRTYGEGFIIADQSPCQLDMSVIRNTNTKIIMRLPDKNDRDLVGKSANLNEDQIIELAKLPCGVAAIYQNNWVEPVLCKVEKASFNNCQYSYNPEDEDESPNRIQEKMNLVKMICAGKLTVRDEAAKAIADMSLPASVQVAILDYTDISSEVPMYRMLGPVVKSLLPQVYMALVRVYTQTSDPVKWSEAIDDSIIAIDGNIEMDILRDIRQIVITQYLVNESSSVKSYNEWRERGVI